MGSVYKDKRSGQPIWAIRFEDVDGSPRKERTKAESSTLARRILAARQNSVEEARLQGLRSIDDLLSRQPSVTLRQFSKEFVTHAQAQTRPNTCARYEHLLRKHVLPALGDLRLTEINPGHVQRFADMRLKDAAPATVRQELAVLSGIFREALKRDLVQRNPVALVRKPRADNEVVRYLNRQEEARLFAFAPEHLRDVILFALNTGLRDAEIRGLTWADVSLEDRHIVVRHTKSKRDRIVPMNDRVFALLDGLPRHISSPYVFTNRETETRYTNAFNNTGWKALLQRAGVENFRFHDLRHSFASRLAQAGVPILAIKELLGHASITMTMRYAHLAPSNRRDAVMVLDRIGAESEAARTHGSTQAAGAGVEVLRKVAAVAN